MVSAVAVEMVVGAVAVEMVINTYPLINGDGYSRNIGTLFHLSMAMADYSHNIGTLFHLSMAMAMADYIRLYQWRWRWQTTTLAILARNYYVRYGK